MLPRKECSSFFDPGGSISGSTCNFMGSGCTPCLEITSPKKGMPTIKISSAEPYIGNALKFHPFFLWNMLPAGKALNGNLMCLYL